MLGFFSLGIYFPCLKFCKIKMLNDKFKKKPAGSDKQGAFNLKNLRQCRKYSQSYNTVLFHLNVVLIQRTLFL